jgi:hypothetical protein
MGSIVRRFRQAVRSGLLCPGVGSTRAHGKLGTRPEVQPCAPGRPLRMPTASGGDNTALALSGVDPPLLTGRDP